MNDKIIKANLIAEAAGLAQKVLPHEVYEGKEKARGILDAARGEAASIVAEAQRQASDIREEARREGSQQGLAEWNQAVADATEARDRLLRESEADLACLAIRVAEKIIGQRLDTDPSAIVSIVGEALKSVRRERALSIQVNPRHLEEVSRGMERLQALVGSSREIRIVASAGVAPGGCIVASEFGTIDAQLETQLACLEKALRRAARK